MLSNLAREAYDSGELEQALELIGQAEELHPADFEHWTAVRATIQAAHPGTAPTESLTEAPTAPPVLTAAPASLAPSTPGPPTAPTPAPVPSPVMSPAIPPPLAPGQSRFRPSATDQLTPSGSRARVRANVQALRVLRELRREERPASAEEQAVLASWSGWGAVPEVFDAARAEFGAERAALAELMDPTERAAAARNTLNAHYTDLSLVTPIWSALQRLGFHGGRVLEPGCGTGNFIGTAPPGAEMVGVELEPITADIAAALYPDARILTESFADTHAPQGSFDLAVGNVPFAKATLTDPLYNRGKHSIHNHFILKSLHLVAPGGLVALITSRYTLDSANPAARREIAALADLVGAIRLPPSAHQRTAGTKVVTDLLVLRRREEEFEPAPVDWELSELVDLAPTIDGQDGAQVRINSYFVTHPEMVCGELTIGRGQFSDAELTVRTDRPAAQLLAEKLDVLVERAKAAELTHRPSMVTAPAQRAALVGRRTQISDGYITTDGQEFTQVTHGAVTPFTVAGTQRAELRALLGLRDGVVALLEAEAASLEATPRLEQLREQLNSRYDSYVAKHGPINRFAWRPTGRTDPATGEKKMAPARPRQGGFRGDPHAPLVYALEEFDSSTQRATKAAIFTQRVVAPRTPRLGADTPEDALAICLDTHGHVDLGEVAGLLGVTEGEARTALGTLVYDDPNRADRLVPAAEYLSGNVRDKLTAARAAAGSSTADAARFGPNIAALAEAIPPDIAPEDIVARLGAAWIDRRYVQDFLRETLQDRSLVVEHAYGSLWIVKGLEVGVRATSTWGTEDMPAPVLAQKLLQQRPLTVYDETPSGANVANPAKTIAAQAKGDELAARFANWVWQDPARAIELARAYNDKFNAIVLRSYDDASLSLPGLALTFHPNPHQVAAVARMIAEPAVGLWHEVGAGKTAEMAMGVMELRRLGMVRKPAIVIPNHMIEQLSREFQQLYPRAKLLAASSDDLTRDQRRAFVARVATGDWDAVIMTRGAFERIPMSPAAQGAYLDDQQAQLRDAIERQKATGERSYSLKRMENTLLNAEERVKDKLAREYDPAITFDKTGIDYLVVDEAQDYKNLRTPSNIPGAQIDGAARASDMEMKLHHLRRRHPGGRVVTFATATPIANSITEAHVMQRYLRPDLLAAAGVLDFDSWAATFGQTVAEVEVSPDGSEFRIKSRFARFHNVPELLKMWWVSGDVKTAEDLNLPRPELIARPGDGQRAPQTITIEPTLELRQFIAQLADRAERVRTRAVKPNEDNMLLIASDGRSAALDLRLVGEHMAPGESKLEIAADKIAEVWARHREDRFTDKAGNPHPVPGALQFVFCDLSTPRDDRWNVYSELRDQLTERGLPREAVRFIHEARNDREKAALFQACRTGQVSVLIGSTSKMGTGTNVQDRAVALHHLDCPWRPADLTQRDGRALRRGNQYSEIGLYRYVVEGSFDAYSWQTVARKAAFIAQIMRGRLDVREIEDVGDSALSYNEVKALAAGNPLLLDKAKADAELTRLDRLERSHVQARSRLRYSISQNEHTITHASTEVAALQQAIAGRRDTRADRFSMTVDGLRFTDRAEAGNALRARLLGPMARPGPSPLDIPAVATLGGLVFDATIWRSKDHASYELVISGIPATRTSGTATELTEARPAGLPIRMENRLDDLDKLLANTHRTIDTCREETARAHEQLERPFPYAADLAAARQRCAELDEQLTLAATPETEAATTPVPEPSATPASHPAMAAAAALRRPPPTAGSSSPTPATAPGKAPVTAPRALPGQRSGPVPRSGNGGRGR